MTPPFPFLTFLHQTPRTPAFYLLIITGVFLTLNCSSETIEPGVFEFADPGYFRNPHITNPRPQVPAPYDNVSGGIEPDGTPEAANGYIYDKHNAHLIVETLDAYTGDPQKYDLIYNWFLGISMPNPNASTSDSTSVFIDWEGENFYIYYPDFYFSILGYNWVWWTFTYELSGEHLTLDGLASWVYIGCSDVSSETSDFTTFHFEGTYFDSENKYQGMYEWKEETSGGLCDKKCTGRMSVVLEY